MKFLAPALALAALVLAPSPAPAADAEAAPAPSALDFSATALDGSEFLGQSLAGKAVLLDFWGSWCAPCIHAFPTLRKLHDDFGDRLQIVGLAYSSGELEEIAAVAAEHGLEYTVVEGTDAALDTFEIFAFPTYVMIDADGEILFAQAGEATDLYERVAGQLAPAQR